MLGFNIDIDLNTGDLSDKFNNINRLLNRVGVRMMRSIDKNFQDETAPDGTPWSPLSPATISERQRRGSGGNFKILQDTGRLKNSIYYEVDKNELKVGTNVSYASKHQFGEDNIPARPFLGISLDDERVIEKMIKDYFNGGI